MPTLVHLRTYQVRPYLAPLLHTGEKKNLKINKHKRGGRGFFACKSGGEKGAVGMKVDNVHEFVKKINNAASVG